MRKIFEVVCGLRWDGGICSRTWDAYMTYDYSMSCYVLWASRYNVVTSRDIYVGLFCDDNYEMGLRVERKIEQCNINMSIDEVLESIGFERVLK